ncbi:hypothetical protein TNCV_2567691 [Trichonephila clavipes]|uniref:Uncharacterized protein n=1 Tax=Trichonephila clavipes TaxID=2585209 RepID=A0A8X6WLR5_TRICX|nr:hypothetical protein TNCV_2567691 [Trichonephila clavipes]
MSGHTDLHVFSRGNVTAPTYREDMLYVYVGSYPGAIGYAFVLQNDNAKRRARIVDAYLEQNLAMISTVMEEKWLPLPKDVI